MWTGGTAFEEYAAGDDADVTESYEAEDDGNISESYAEENDWNISESYAEEDNGNISDEDVICIYGGGYGHGNGMSQYGAAQMAADGASYLEILEYYYGIAVK